MREAKSAPMSFPRSKACRQRSDASSAAWRGPPSLRHERTAIFKGQNWGNAMLRLRYLVVCFALGFSILVPQASGAEQAFQRFLPLLVDLDGWTGKKADGVSMEMGSMSMTTANRDYTKGSSELHASVVVGQAAVAALAPLQNAMNIETTDGHMVTAQMHGMNVLKGYNNKDKSGSLIVGVTKDAMFNLSYKNMTEDEALA